MKITRGRLFPLFLVLAVAAGCDNRDESNPLSGGTGGTSDLDPDMAQQQALSAIEMTNGLTSGVHDLARGDFSNLSQDLGLPANTNFRNDEEVVWNESLGAWVLDAEATETDASGTATMDIYVWIRFLDGLSQPQQEPDTTTAAMAMGMDMSFSLYAEDQGEVFDMSMDFALEMEVAGLPDGPYLIDGEGDMSGSILWTGFGNEDLNAQFAMAWSMDMLVPASGCPTGNIQMSVDQYSMNATYDGDSSYDWVMYENGRIIDRGSDSAGCTVVTAN